MNPPTGARWRGVTDGRVSYRQVPPRWAYGGRTVGGDKRGKVCWVPRDEYTPPMAPHRRLRRAGYSLLREGPVVEIWGKLRRDGHVVLLSAIMRGVRDEGGNVPSTVWKLSVVKYVNPRQRGELQAMLLPGRHLR